MYSEEKAPQHVPSTDPGPAELPPGNCSMRTTVSRSRDQCSETRTILLTIVVKRYQNGRANAHWGGLDRKTEEPNDGGSFLSSRSCDDSFTFLTGVCVCMYVCVCVYLFVWGGRGDAVAGV